MKREIPCDNPAHAHTQARPEGRIFSLSVLAVEVGAGHRKREIRRYSLDHWCEGCLAVREFPILGAQVAEARPERPLKRL